jgi:hypothetical protein
MQQRRKRSSISVTDASQLLGHRRSNGIPTASTTARFPIELYELTLNLDQNKQLRENSAPAYAGNRRVVAQIFWDAASLPTVL